MKCVILAAGYATRLRPLTDDVPKHLLPVGERPMLDWVLDRVREVEDVDTVHLVTNSRFAPAFRRWAEVNEVAVYDDGTTSNEDRLGAVGDLRLAIDEAGLDDDELVVLAGDNLFEFSLPRFVEWWRSKPQPASARATAMTNAMTMGRRREDATALTGASLGGVEVPRERR